VATAKGPPLTESSVNAQTLSAYLELLFPGSERFSIFGELPERFINPDVNANNWGISDVNFGFKYALLYDAGDTRYYAEVHIDVRLVGQQRAYLGTQMTGVRKVEKIVATNPK